MRKKLQNVTKLSEFWLLFIAVAFPVHVWSIFNLFYVLPAWMLKMDYIELFGAISYTFLFALFESTVITIFVFLFVQFILNKIFPDKYLTFGILVIWLLSILAVGAHYSHVVNLWGFLNIGLLGLLSFVFIILLVSFLLKKYSKVENIIFFAIDRLAILISIYLIIDVMSLINIVFRNL
jgi:hypothetical protein